MGRRKAWDDRKIVFGRARLAPPPGPFGDTCRGLKGHVSLRILYRNHDQNGSLGNGEVEFATEICNGATAQKGDKGETGEKGEKGDAFVYADFTQEQLTAL